MPSLIVILCIFAVHFFIYSIMSRCIRIIFFVFCISLPFSSIKAGVVDHDKMFQAFLADDMKVWGVELSSYVKNDNLSYQDKFEICNYLYGYVAAILEDADKNTVKKWLDVFDALLDDLEKTGKYTSEVCVFRSSVYAYKAKKFSSKMLSAASNCFKELDKAFAADKNCAIAHGLKGNIEFYLPAFMGGSKKDAIVYFSKALELMATDKSSVYRWNWCATSLCLAQAYEKTNQIEKAVAVCKATLRTYPDFKYMRDVYFPSIKNKK